MVMLAEAKNHLRIDTNEEDDLVQGMIDAAEDHLRSIDIDLSVDPLPPALHHAILLLTGHFYEQREAASQFPVQTIPFGVERLVAPYRSIGL